MLKIHQKIKNAKPATLSSPQPLQIKKGETTLTLTDVKTGEVQVYHDTNMQTNALNEMLRNCGWLNRDNWDQNNLITQLLGGVLLFNTAITEDANIVMPPAGLTMTANCSMDATTTQAGDPTELGTYRPDESGLQGDNSYLLTYDWATAQGNGVIACICATNRQFGYGGCGNATSNVSKSSKTTYPLTGTSSEISIVGIPCGLSLEDSSVYGVDFSDISNGNVTIRKFRLPINRVNLLGTMGEPVVLSEVTLSGSDVPQSLKSVGGATYQDDYMPCVDLGTAQDVDGHLMILSVNTNSNNLWGSGYTQYLWDIDPVNGTITEEVLLNTSGDDLHAITFPVWMGRDCLAWIEGYDGYTYATSYAKRDGRTVYSMKRTNGTWSAIQKCTNPIGQNNNNHNCGWRHSIQTSDGKAYVVSGRNEAVVFDYTENAVWRTNANDNGVNRNLPTDFAFIKYSVRQNNNGRYTINVKRTQMCIATINNLSTAVVKDSSKMMKLQYRFTFEEEPEEGTSTS